MSDWTFRQGTALGNPPAGWKIIFDIPGTRIEFREGDIPFAAEFGIYTDIFVLIYGTCQNKEEWLLRMAAGRLTDAIAMAWQKWGTSTAEKLQGTCAGLIYDRRQEKLYIFRDRLGLIPLMTVQKEGCWLCTTAPDIMAEETADFPINMQRIGMFLRHGECTDREDFKSNTARILPGEYLVRTENRVSYKLYWSPDTHVHDESFESARTRLDQAFCSAIQNIPNPDDSILTLSGGLDSGGILGHLLRQFPDRHWKAFSSISPNYPIADESDALDTWEKDPRVHIFRFDMENAWSFSSPQEYLAPGFGPLKSPGLEILTDSYRKIKALCPNPQIVTGYGGNYLASVRTEALLRQLWEMHDYKGLCTELRLLSRAGRKATIHRFIANFNRGMLFRKWQSAPDFIRKLLPYNRAQNQYESFFRTTFSKEFPPQACDPTFDWRHGEDKRNTLLSWEWELSWRYHNHLLRLTGVRWHDPLCDPGLWETCMQIPAKYFMSGGKQRILWREALRDYLPAQIADRPKKQFFDPIIGRGIGEKATDEILSLMQKKTWLSENVFQPDKVCEKIQQYADNYRRGVRPWKNAVGPVWRFIAAQLWATHVQGDFYV